MIGLFRQWITVSRSAWRQLVPNTCVTWQFLTQCFWNIWKETICALIINGSVNHTLTTIRAWGGAHTQGATIVSSTKIMVSVMFSVSVETLSVSSAVKNHTVLAVAKQLFNGRLKILMKARTLPGSWPTRNNARSVKNQLKRTKVAIIWLASSALMSFAGFASETGRTMVRRQVAITNATNTKN